MKKWPDKMPKLAQMLPADGWWVKYQNASNGKTYTNPERVIAWGLTTSGEMIGVVQGGDGLDYAERQHPDVALYFRK